MRLLAGLALLCLALAGTGTGQSFGQLQKLCGKDKDGVAQLELSQFMKHVVSEDKDYAVVVQLTALSPRYKCDTCHVVDRALRAVSRGWKKGGGTKRRLAFGTLDVEDGEELFQQMGIDKIPRIMIFPAGKGPEAMANSSPREMKLGARTSHAEGMAARLSELFGVEIKADMPVDLTKYAVKGAAITGAAYASLLAYRHINMRMLGRNMWAVATITFVLLMTSGFMWNRINSPPYLGQARGGDPVLFAPTQSQQFGVETQIVATGYAACALCVLLLVRHVPRVSGAEQRTLVTFMVVASMVLVCSYLNSVFRLKMPGYPYKLLLP
ncbi:oligosaccharyl transferase subunit ost3/OST6 [Coemansia sp. RSA 988]|nr:oligosaccharyl transferase subunit ost3/OST6 [Coemansia sp. RSA 988]